MASLNIKLSEGAKAFAASEAARLGLADAEAYVAELLEKTADQRERSASLAGFHDAVTDLDDLLRTQGVKPFSDMSELTAEFWPQNESADDIIAAAREWRRER